MTSGRSFRPPLDPPMVAEVPWFRLTLDWYYTSDINKSVIVEPATIQAALISQLGLDPTKASLEIRLRSVSAWAIKLNSFLALSCYDPIGTSQNEDALTSLVDQGTDVIYPRCGYQWPLAAQSIVLRKQVDRIVKGVVGDKDITVYFQFDLWFRGKFSQSSVERFLVYQKLKSDAGTLNTYQVV